MYSDARSTTYSTKMPTDPLGPDRPHLAGACPECDGRSVTVQQSGVRWAYVILDPASGPWVSDYKYRSERTARAAGQADLDWLRDEEAKD